MAQRYSRILSSARYYSAISRYISHVQGTATRTSRIGQGEPRPISQKLYVMPFAVSLAAGQKVPVTAAQPTWNTYAGQFTGRTDATTPANENLIIKLDDYAAARVVIKTGMRSQATVATSQVTGLQYGSYGGRSTSIPFGKKTDTDGMLAAFTEIKTGLTPSMSGNYAISLIKEKFAA